MAANFQFIESNGPSETPTEGVTSCNWKALDSASEAGADHYSQNPIVAGQNSFEKWIYGKFSGTYTEISGGKWAHTAGNFGTGITLKASKSMTQDSDRLAYTPPSQNLNALLTYDATAVTGIASGKQVWFGPTSPGASGKVASSTSNPAYTNYLTTQLQTVVGAQTGDTDEIVLTFQYREV